MDGSRFDSLSKRLATTSLPRASLLRGLALAGVAAVTGMSLVAEEAEADDKKPRKKRVCLCSAAGCRSKKVRKPKKIIKRNAPCAYRGRCSTNPCAAGRVGCQFNTDCPAGQVCQNGICVISSTSTTIITQPCSAANCPFFCVNNVCVQCRTSGDCPPGQTCSAAGICVGPGPDLCGNTCTPGEQVCCPAGTDKAGICVGNFTACQADQ